jgi:hypothetical protein
MPTNVSKRFSADGRSCSLILTHTHAGKQLLQPQNPQEEILSSFIGIPLTFGRCATVMTMRFLVAFTLLMGGAMAFGPATPVVLGKWVGGGIPQPSQGGGMTMRVGKNDLLRRQKINDLLDISGSKEKVETVLLSENTSRVLEKCNWKLHNALMRKVMATANAFDVQVDPKFGQKPTPSERLIIEQNIRKNNLAIKEERGMCMCVCHCCCYLTIGFRGRTIRKLT